MIMIDRDVLKRHNEHPIESIDKSDGIYLRGSDLVYWLRTYGEIRAANWIQDILDIPAIEVGRAQEIIEHPPIVEPV